MPAILSIIGKSGSGKTTLIEKLIPELKRRGYRVGTIKHTVHDFDLDSRGKDSWRHKTAGAETVMLAAPQGISLVKGMRGYELDDLEAYFEDIDLIITEGFKRGSRPKIEIFRTSAHREPLFSGGPDLIAMVSDSPVERNIPVFGLDDIAGIVDLIEEKMIAGTGWNLQRHRKKTTG
jgi:molybdopterin-guanine dinucleotide biosynthesis protein MobB